MFVLSAVFLVGPVFFFSASLVHTRLSFPLRQRLQLSAATGSRDSDHTFSFMFNKPFLLLELVCGRNSLRSLFPLSFLCTFSAGFFFLLDCSLSRSQCPPFSPKNHYDSVRISQCPFPFILRACLLPYFTGFFSEPRFALRQLI